MPLSELQNGRLRLAVKLTPRSKTQGLAGVQGDRLLIRLAAPPVDGKANMALVAYLAKLLGIRKTQVLISSGEKSRQKILELDGVNYSQACQLLGLTSPESS